MKGLVTIIFMLFVIRISFGQHFNKDSIYRMSNKVYIRLNQSNVSKVVRDEDYTYKYIQGQHERVAEFKSNRIEYYEEDIACYFSADYLDKSVKLMELKQELEADTSLNDRDRIIKLMFDFSDKFDWTEYSYHVNANNYERYSTYMEGFPETTYQYLDKYPYLDSWGYEWRTQPAKYKKTLFGKKRDFSNNRYAVRWTRQILVDSVVYRFRMTSKAAVPKKCRRELVDCMEPYFRRVVAGIIIRDEED